MKLIFFRTPKPRGFQYKPRYYDPSTQDNRFAGGDIPAARAQGEDAQYPTRGADGVECCTTRDDGQAYNPGEYIRSVGIRRSRPGIASRLAQKRQRSLVRMVAMAIAIGFIILWVFLKK